MNLNGRFQTLKRLESFRTHRTTQNHIACVVLNFHNVVNENIEDVYSRYTYKHNRLLTLKFSCIEEF